jgi:MFS family permease
MAPLTAAIIAMLIQQSLMTMTTAAIPALWVYIGPDFGLTPAQIAVYSLAVYCIGFFSSSAAGSSIIRFGPLRSSQMCLIAAAWAMLVASFGVLWLILPAALLLGAGMGPSTPSSSQILARFATTQQAPLVFSIKQTGVPIGGFMAGAVLLPIAHAFSWEVALFITGCVAWAAAIWMQRFRDRFDDQRIPTKKVSLADIGISFRAATRTPALRKLAFSGFAFSGLQVAFMYYFITYAVTDIQLDPVIAGRVFGAASLVAIAGRIFWGWLAGWHVSPRLLLVILSVAMFVSAATIGMATPEWGVYGLGAAAIAFGATGVSWNGVHLAEVARNAPTGQVPVVMGGVMSCCFLGLITIPALYGAIFVKFGLSGIGFTVIAAPALLCALLFALPDRTQ